MANSPQARKRARQNTNRRELNMGQRSAMRTIVKNCQKSLAAGDSEAAASAYKAAVAAVDRGARKGLTNKNKAGRLKSRLNARLRALSTSV
ncbi:MAG: 30S ribosomal protein S20 [Gammaproteobacteria bacterium]|nr:30S ribosomal protein S20 [Gammaproteobacteria bacterium]MDH3467833.1 30S ribosomal protein S20 [Gammaproteobacteria bacterium]